MQRFRVVSAALIVGLLGLPYSYSVTAATASETTKVLLDAVWRNDLAAVQRAIGEGADPSASDEAGLSAVDIAVDKGYFDIAHYLLAAQQQVTDANQDAAQSPVANAQNLGSAPVSRVKATALEPENVALSPAVAQPTRPVAQRAEVMELRDEAPEPILVLPKVSEADVKKLQEPKSGLSRSPLTNESPGQQGATSSGSEKPSLLDQLSRLLPDFASDGDEGLKLPIMGSNPRPDELRNDAPSPKTVSSGLPQNEPKPTKEPLAQASAKSAPKVEAGPPPEPIQIPAPEPAVEFAPKLDAEMLPDPKPEVAAVPDDTGIEGGPRELEPESQDGINWNLLEVLNEIISPRPKEEPETRSSSLEELEIFDPNSADQPTPVIEIEALPQSGDGTVATAVSEPEVVSSPSRKNENRLEQVPARTEAKAPGESFNPFAKLTDFILDILPDKEKPAAEDTATTGLPKPDIVTPGTSSDVRTSLQTEAKPDAGSVKFAVQDLTEGEDPYKREQRLRQQISRDRDVQNSAEQDIDNGTEKNPTEEAALRQPEPPVRSVLLEDELVFGDRGFINLSLEAAEVGMENCVVKPAWQSHFCIQPSRWPAEIQGAFGAQVFFSGGGASIVHYIDGNAAQYHGLYPTKSFDLIKTYLVSKYGTPTETPEIWTALLAEPKRRNLVHRWTAIAKDGGPDIVLEIRQIDDLRWSSPPDKTNGLIRMYRKGDQSIFRLLTTADLLLLQVRKGSNTQPQ